MSSNKLYPYLSKALSVILGIGFICLGILNIKKQNHLLGWIFLWLSMFVLTVIFLYKKLCQIDWEKRSSKKVILLVSVTVFLIQMVIAVCIYTEIDWDPGTVIGMAEQLAKGEPLFWPEYFAKYPNNLFLLVFFEKIFRLVRTFGITRGYFEIAIGVNIVVVDITIILLAIVAKWLLGKEGVILTTIFAIFMIGLNPWIVIPYSDTLGMIFPVALFVLYLYGKRNEKKKVIVGVILGITAAVGYQIKPHVTIILIAILLIETMYYNFDRRHLYDILKYAGCIFISFCITFATVKLYMNYEANAIMTEQMREEYEFPFTHYIMMGLNEETTGSFNIADANATAGIPGKDKKSEFNRQIIAQRMKKYGMKGYLQFCGKKTAKIYEDGTFNYGTEGDFASCTPYRSGKISKGMQSIFHITGKYYEKYSALLQGYWLILLAGMALPFWKRERQICKEIDILRLTIVGLTIFLLLVEGRARYLYHAMPLFVLLGVYGWQLKGNILLLNEKGREENERKNIISSTML